MKKAVFSLITFVSFSTFAQIETDRPDFTESPNTVPKGALQVETGFVLENDNSAMEQRNSKIQLSERNYTANTTLFRLGLTEQFELRLNTNYGISKVGNMNDIGILDSTHNPNLSDISGFKTSFVGFKTNVYQTQKISIGILGHLYIPELSSGDFKMDNQKVASELLFPVSYQITERFGVAAQYGISWDGISPNPTTSYTLALGYAITDHLNCYIEPYGFLTNNGDELHLVNGGFTYLVNDNFQLDLTGGFGLNDEAPDNFISCGASFLLFNK